MSAPILIMAGGTGGHVFPALAVAECLRAQGVAVVWMGTPTGLEAKLVPPAGFPVEWIRVRGVRGTGLKRRLTAPFMLLAALVQAGAALRRQRPAAVLGMGGFATGPGGVMARLFGIPLVVHEQNARAGLTNRWLARLAARVLEAFPDSFPPTRRAQTVGNPVRAAIAALPPPAARFAGRDGPRRLLVIGGSQGAKALNELAPAALALVPDADRPQVRHQAGGQWLDIAERAYQAAGVTAQVTPFIADMADAYGWADLVLCRAGALTIAELAAAGVGAILVPFPFAVDDHQTANGRFLERVGAAVLAPQAELTPERLAALLRERLAERAPLLAMATAARAQARVEAAAQVAAVCLEQAGAGSRRA